MGGAFGGTRRVKGTGRRHRPSRKTVFQYVKIHRPRSAPRVLVVSDDGSVKPLIAELTDRGLDVHAANRGRYAVRIAGSARPDLVVLDTSLPDDDGLQTYDGLRGAGVKAPVLLLTAPTGALAEPRERLIKPFALADAVARVESLLGRAQPAGEGPLVHLGGLTLDPDSREAWRDGARAGLSAREYELLSHLASNAGQVVTRRGRSSTGCGAHGPTAAQEWWRRTSTTCAANWATTTSR